MGLQFSLSLLWVSVPPGELLKCLLTLNSWFVFSVCVQLKHDLDPVLLSSTVTFIATETSGRFSMAKTLHRECKKRYTVRREGLSCTNLFLFHPTNRPSHHPIR